MAGHRVAEEKEGIGYLSKPEVSQSPGVIKYAWQDEHVEIMVTRLKEHSDRVTGELKITTTDPNFYGHIHQAQFNFSAARSRKELAGILIGRYKASWEEILESLCKETIAILREGEPLEEVWPADYPLPTKYLLRPLLPENESTILFADKGHLKSYIGLLIMYALVLPWHKNPLGLRVPNTSQNGLYLDWETTRDTFEKRHTQLSIGMGLEKVKLNYQRCYRPLAEDMERILNRITETDSRFVVIDSMGWAVGDELNPSGPAIQFFTGVRQLGVTALVLAQTSKDKESKTKTPYGSTFFRYAPRSIWEIRKSQEVGSNEASIALYHREGNDSQMHHPLGFKFTFVEVEEDTYTLQVAKEDPRTVADFVEEHSKSSMIYELLKAEPLTLKGIAEELDYKQDFVRTNLFRMMKRGQVVKSGDKWGLKADV